MSAQHEDPAVIDGQLDIYDQLDQEETTMTDGQQIRPAVQIEEAAHELARSTRTLERPSDWVDEPKRA